MALRSILDTLNPRAAGRRWIPAILWGTSLGIGTAAQPTAQAPAPLVGEIEKQPWISLDAFIQKQIAPASDPKLVASLGTLFQVSARFKPVLESLWTEQPRIRITLMAIADLDASARPKQTEQVPFGLLFLKSTSSGYDIVVAVQTALELKGQDMTEPWLAQILFALLEVSRNDAVEEKGRHLLMSRKVQRRMWDFQRQVRSELKASQPEAFSKMAYDGEYLYKMKLLWSK